MRTGISSGFSIRIVIAFSTMRAGLCGAREILVAETKKIGLVGATFLVAGNMMGSGVFLLPSSLAKIGTASIWGWLVTTAGALLLAFVFAKLGKLAPKAGGPYAYARDWFGPYMGFQTNTIYWFANWIGNVAIPIAAVGYFSHFSPFFPILLCGVSPY